MDGIMNGCMDGLLELSCPCCGEVRLDERLPYCSALGRVDIDPIVYPLLVPVVALCSTPLFGAS